jgi:D-amino-acid oxidase
MPTVSEIIVVGCGVSGLSCAIKLLERFPASVRIIAHELPPHTTSNIAGAFFEPYEAHPRDRVLNWSKISLAEFVALTNIPEAGVAMVKVVRLFEGAGQEQWWWHDLKVSAREALPSELPPNYKCGFVTEVPKIETPRYIPYLQNRFIQAGGKIEKLSAKVNRLSEVLTPNSVIVNCTGLGAAQLCDDSNVFPIRGQIALVRAPEIGEAVYDGSTERDLAYIVPREDACLLGGTHEVNDWRLEPDRAIAQGILSRCRRLLPGLDQASVIEHKVGLRPGRNEVRLELEPVSDSCAVVHNYGHGGAGFSLSWGCAVDVVKLVASFLGLHPD